MKTAFCFNVECSFFLLANSDRPLYSGGMNNQEICQRIFDIASEYARKAASPVSFVNLSVSGSCAVSDEELWNGFDKIRWDTDLASAELMITRENPDKAAEEGYVIKVKSLSLFEEDDQVGAGEPVLPVQDGTVL